ncbi:V-type ATP synthase subunit E [Lachnoclostridium edouardi]|uniref:V-type ATP synthase subunit E n=1 Tax=Lachnoclostridium edouardi TaxID=1926283 RepID=UPI000C7CEBEF|nr:V-type ATP synthase subunit E [Lachnoclostridium edouardi]MDO4278127.1 V-type ATP synthase subunit E [Lachnoclostridium edouardi]
MAGLDKIISHILEEAGNEARAIEKKSEAEAESIRQEAVKICEKLKADSSVKMEEEEKARRDRAESSAQLQKRQAVLLAKQQIISDMLDQAYTALLNKDTAEYFQIILTMLEKFALDKPGMICFSKRDLERMPVGFQKEVVKAAEKKGGKLEISQEGKDIDGGFILIYGGVEENCSFKALFNARRDELSDKVHQLLFA